jgi:hypothetical protein
VTREKKKVSKFENIGAQILRLKQPLTQKLQKISLSPTLNNK